MAKRHASARTVPITVEIDGKEHRGEYFVEKGMIIVSSPLLGSETTQLGAIPADSLARQLLTELVGKARNK